MEKPKLYEQLGVEGFLDWTNVEIFKDVIETVQPKSILEIGFYKGASSFFWLYLSQAKLLSVDSMLWDGCSIENVHKLLKQYPERFSFLCDSSLNIKTKLINQEFDLMFIDGGHTPDIYVNDIQLALDLNVNHIFIDDCSKDIFVTFRKMVLKDYDIIRRYDRKTDREFIPMLLAKKKIKSDKDELDRLVEKWDATFNKIKVEIPSMKTKLKRKIIQLCLAPW